MSRIDLDAARDEASEEPHVVTYGGEEFTVPSLEDWPLETVDQLNAGQVTAAMQGAMGDEQWARFTAHRPSLRVIRLLVESITEAQGLESSGNSSGSSRSSRSTGTRSRRTSNSGTASTRVTSGAPADG